MRIALISTAIHACPPITYGSEASTWYLAEELCRRGHEVFLFAPQGSREPSRGRLIPIPLAAGYNMAKIPELEATPAARYLGILKRCDVVHDMSLTGKTAWEVCRQLGDKLPHLLTLNGICFLVHPPATHGVVVVSEAARRAGLEGRHAWINTPWEKEFGGNVGQLTEDPFVVPYGTDTEFYRPADDAPTLGVVYVGRPHPAKGIDLILDLAARMPDEEFVLAWHAELPDHRRYDQQYKAERERRKLENVRFIDLPNDARHHVQKRYWQADAAVAIHPAIYLDAQPAVVLEALACGTPVVTTAHGGAQERMQEGDGLCLPIPPEYWKEPTYSTWLDDWAAAIKMAKAFDRKAIRERAVATLSASVMADKYLDLYGKVCNGQR